MNLGDRAIFNCYGNPPVLVNISKVTPKGAIRVSVPFGEHGISEAERKISLYLFDSGGYPKGNHSVGRVYPFTQEKFDELTKNYQEYTERLRLKAEEQQRTYEERENEAKARLAACKLALGDYTKLAIFEHRLFPEQTLFVFKVPTQKGKEIFAFVRVQSCKDKAWRDAGEFEGNMTYVTENSFPSCSSIYGKTVDEIVWECLEHVYYSW